jgi:hypothetical protein
MQLSVRGAGPAGPFLGARDVFETECDLAKPVTVHVREDPDERTRVSHDDEGHHLVISRQAATSAMARELALHEFAHMRHHETGHPSHTQSIEEVIFLALAGHSVERRKLTHCYQIANHMKDIYADDLWMRVAPGDKLVAFMEASLAAAVADRPARPPAWDAVASPPATPPGERADDRERSNVARSDDSPVRRTADSDPDITAVNAAFALGLVERHGLVGDDHRLYDLAHAAANDAPDVDFAGFKRRFRTLDPDPDESGYRKALVDVTRDYVTGGDTAAD